MLTFKVIAKYGIEDTQFTQHIIAHTPELAAVAAEKFIQTKILDCAGMVRILEVREVR